MSKRFEDFVKRFNVKDAELVARVGMLPCQACGVHPAGDAHHIKTRGAGGQDLQWNLMPLCRGHHRAVHDKGLTTLARDHMGVLTFLEQNGWTFDEFMRRWQRNRFD